VEVRRSQLGFTLLETAVAVAIVTVTGAFAISAIAAAFRWNTAIAQRTRSETAAATLADRLQADASSAGAIFSPPADAYGSSNSDGHEVDFFVRDAQNRAHFWAYVYDKANRRIQRVLYGAPGDTPAEDGAPFTGIDAFTARTYPVTALQDPESLIYSPLYANANLHAATVRFDPARAWIAGGNNISDVRLRSGNVSRELQLSTQTAPSGFTVLLRYTPSPAASQTPNRLTAAVVTAQVAGTWEDCPSRADCSNAEWPQYHWLQTTTSMYYESFDGGNTWALFNTDAQRVSGISGPTGGDLPPPCAASADADYLRLCSADWVPRAPAGTTGMDLGA
jgi:Tfp pilus assembly protein PilV